MKTNLRVTMQAPKTLRIDIYDVIGWNWYDGGITAQTISKKLQEAGDIDTVHVHVNSPGGDAFEGIAIHNILKSHPAKVKMRIEGVAASAASVVLMAGDEVEIPTNAMIMIHDPATFAFGGEDEMQKAINRLKAVKDATVNTYHAKCGKSKEQVATWMTEEKWFTGQEAVDAGLADKTAEAVTLPKVEKAESTNQLFRKAPPENYSALVALCATAPPPVLEKTNVPEATTTTTTPNPAPTPVTTPAPAQVSQADVDSQVATKTKEVEQAERNRAGDIMAVCTLAKKPEMAAEFIKNGTNLSDVRQKLLEVVCSQNQPVGDAPNNNITPPVENGPDAKFKKEYAENKAEFERVGMTEADYVKQRRVDEGLDELKPAKK